MQKSITLFVLFLFSLNGFSQKLDYDHDSKWFFGFNVGGTWNTTDVRNKTNLGWGFTLGRAFNYNYGKNFSYDLRLRYLGGNWYGQDYDTTNVLGNSRYAQGGAVHNAYDSLGYTINNFNTEAHEIGLELVVHFNRSRERVGFDPYIFGGVGLAWTQTHGDLYSQDLLDSLNNDFYHYNTSGISKSEWNTLSDDIYDTPLDGSKNAYTVSVVPNVGIGFAYQVGPKFSIGLEHRTMFFLKNTFDGYAGTSKKWGMDNDIYHYSALSLKFHIGRGRTDTDVDNSNNNSNTLNNGGGCKTPQVSIRRPSQATSTTDAKEYAFEATVSEIAGRENVQLIVNGSQSTNFNYNPSTGKLTANILLKEGSNEIRVLAANGCGSDEERVVINQVNCTMPEVRFLKPSAGSLTVNQPTYDISANILNAAGVEYYINGVSSGNYSLNNGNLSGSVALRQGSNTLKIVARNECGVTEQNVTINYANCASPVVTLMNGSGTVKVTEPVYNLRANMAFVTARENMQFTVNGVNKEFTYVESTNTLKGAATLSPGINTLVVSAANDCGTHSATVLVEYTPCNVPVVSFIDPAGGSVSVNASTYQLKAKVDHVNNIAQIQVKINGVTRTGGNFNASTQILTQTISLVEGTNTVEIVATNECSNAKATATINRRACPGPQISMVQPAGQTLTVQAPTFAFSARVQHISNANQVQLLINGVNVTGGTYNMSSGIFSRTFTLNPGTNTLKLIATNECSSQEVNYTITYTPCIAPVVALVDPAAGTAAVNSFSYQFKAQIEHVSNVAQIQLKVNGVVRTGGNYNASTKLYTHTVSISEGQNVIDLVVTNECGTANAHATITKRACIGPQISMIQPAAQTTSVNAASYAFSAKVQNVANANQMQFQLNGVSQSGGSYNATSGVFSKTVTLNSGTNTLKLIATNECSSQELTYTIIYTPCMAPVVTMIAPTAIVNTEVGTYELKATVTNVSAVNQLELKVNGVVVPGGNFNPSTGMYSIALNLAEGNNAFTLKATNECGSDSKRGSIRYAPCLAPVITMIEPTASSVNSETGTLQVRASIQDATDISQISMKVNGVTQSGGTFNASTGEYVQNITVHEASNTVVITVVTDCGQASYTFKVRHTSPCNPPTASIVSPTVTTTTASSIVFEATILNVSNISMIKLKVNGAEITGATFNAASGMYQKQIDLNVGTNTIKLTATTDCGTVVKNLEITRTEEQKITICHYPPGNTENPQQIEIPLSAWPAHQAHGDVMGSCPASNGNSNETPNQGSGIGIGGSGGSGGGTVIGGGNSGGNNDGSGNDGGGENGGSDGDEKNTEEEGGKGQVDKPTEVKPVEGKPKGDIKGKGEN